jgi:hypothetical protein
MTETGSVRCTMFCAFRAPTHLKGEAAYSFDGPLHADGQVLCLQMHCEEPRRV